MIYRFFIGRPILSGIISTFIVAMGVIAYFVLPVEQFPDIAPPTIRVQANYPGASAETIIRGVISPLEEAINGVEDMTYMTSTASNAGSASITVYFRQGTDPDMAAVNVQNRVQRATRQLPAEVTQTGVTVSKRQTSMLQVFALYSPDDSYDENFIANYINITLKPELLRIPGVGDLMVMGNDYSMRVWLKPDVMAQHGLVPSDISAVLAEQNLEAATGSFGENTDEMQQYSMKYKGRLLSAEEFGDIVVRSTPDGQVLRLKELANIELGRTSYTYTNAYDGHTGVTAIAYQTAGSNATEVNEQINHYLEKAAKSLPSGLKIETLRSTNDYLYPSIDEVVKTLIEAIVLVLLVVYVFLQDLRSAFIPLVSIFVSLIGTFAFMALMGFSINLLTLFALILVIGTVVDDSIIVVEAVQERFDAGYHSPYLASVDAMNNIGKAVITSSLVFMAVFIPVAFVGGTSGTFYTQFGLTMAAAVGISAVNALTLSPALCALLLRANSEGHKGRFASKLSALKTAFRTAFSTLSVRYSRGVFFFVKRRWMAWTFVGLSIALLVFFLQTTKKGLVPEEDQGFVTANVTAAPGSSLHATQQLMKQINDRISQIPQVSHLVAITGWGTLSGVNSSAGTFMVKLKPWDERTTESDQSQAVIDEIYARTADIKDASIFVMSPGMIPGYGTSNAIDLNLQDLSGGDMYEFFRVVQDYIAELSQRPEIARAYTAFDMGYPQWQVDVDAAKCKRAGVSPEEVLSVLSGYYSGQYVSNFNRFSRIYQVMIQAAPDYRLDERSLAKHFVRTDRGEMAPLSQFVKFTKVYGAQVLNRFNMYNSIGVSVSPAEGYSTGDAIKAVKEVAETALPIGYSYDFGGITREENMQTSNTVVIFAICLLMIYLFLAALYESLLLPFAVLLSVPAGLVGSFLFAQAMGLENNIYLQTGLIMLIGLLSKTAILLTEYATVQRHKGRSLVAASVAAARVRLRPILMTVLAMVFGMLPLMFSSGVGAHGNSSLGTGVVGGILVGTLSLLFVVPALFIPFQWLHERTSRKRQL